jgi:hypothetical protein
MRSSFLVSMANALLCMVYNDLLLLLHVPNRRSQWTSARAPANSLALRDDQVCNPRSMLSCRSSFAPSLLCKFLASSDRIW